MPDENPTSKTIDKTSHGMSYKVFALIGVLAIIDLVYGLYYFDGSFFDIKDGFFMAGIAACGISSFVVAKKYHGSEMLGKAYLFLGLGFFSWFIGDVGYYHAQFVLGIDPWPSIFDLGFLLSYVFCNTSSLSKYKILPAKMVKTNEGYSNRNTCSCSYHLQPFCIPIMGCL